MDLKINELKCLLESLEISINNQPNDEMLKLKERLVKHIDYRIKFEKENKGKLTGFKELDYPDMP